MKYNKKFRSATLALAVVILVLVIISSTAAASNLYVGSTAKYKTIQSAVNASKSGDTINVAYGTYKETVRIDKRLTILGTKYPKVNGFYYENGGTGTINGFSIQKDGIGAWYSGGYANTIRNNYFYNCGIYLGGGVASDSIIMNNQIKNGTIYLYDSFNQTIKGNIISNSNVGLYIGDMAGIPTVTKNTFKYCGTAVYFYGWEQSPGRLNTFTGNTYIGNKVNIGWGTTAI